MNLPGSYQTTKKDGTIYYRSSCTYQNKHISLGSFPTAWEAHEAYKQALEVLNTPPISIDAYPENGWLSFEKWVVLINFRDNDIYFATPIFLCFS